MVEQLTLNQLVEGSSPSWCTICTSLRYASNENIFDSVAQLVEQWPFKPLVERSSRSGVTTFPLAPKAVANHFEKPLPTQLRYKTSFGKGGFFLSCYTCIILSKNVPRDKIMSRMCPAELTVILYLYIDKKKKEPPKRLPFSSISTYKHPSTILLSN